MADKINFEEKLNELNQIVKEIESGDLSLEVSLKKFEEGKKIVKLLEDELTKAEAKVEEVLK